jgi:glyoxylate utilization-related uncharacterized protein
MPKFSKATLEGHDYGPVLDHHAEVDGYTVNITTFNQDIDATPLMKGLPGDRCHCSHWGYVIKGQITFRFADHDEVVRAGDAFYLPPGHIPVVEAGTEYVQFSPSKEMAEVSEHMVRATQQMMQQQA